MGWQFWRRRRPDETIKYIRHANEIYRAYLRGDMEGALAESLVLGLEETMNTAIKLSQLMPPGYFHSRP